MSKIKLALLSGGISGEREVSLKTGQQIFDALDKDKYEIYQYDPQNDLNSFFNAAAEGKFDVVFPALHGPYGEDGKLQGMLDMIKVPYVFPGCLASALAMDKHLAKIIAASEGLPALPSLVIKKGEALNHDSLAAELKLPLVIKPVELGSSVGITIAKDIKELKKGIDKAFKFDKRLLLEKFIKGRELTVTVMQKGKEVNALPVIEIIPKKSAWFDYKAKYEPGASEEICPAEIPPEASDRAKSYAVKIFKAINCKDLSRVDFIWQENEDKIYFLELNTIPGMTATSLAPQSAKAAGMSFSEFLDIMIENNLR